MEKERLAATNQETTARHIARVQAVLEKYNITDPDMIANLDETGISFRELLASSKKVVGHATRGTYSELNRTRGSLDHVTVMEVVAASGRVYNPCVILPGVRAAFRTVNNVHETVHTYLPFNAYVYMRRKAGMDKHIFYDGTKHFIDETKQPRSNSKFMVIIGDGYYSHIQWDVLNLFENHRIIIIVLPSHSSHYLQPLDVSVFGYFKIRIRQELSNISSVANQIDVFNASNVIGLAYCASFIRSNIMSGFVKTGVWNNATKSISIQSLPNIDFNRSVSRRVTLQQIIYLMQIVQTNLFYSFHIIRFSVSESYFYHLLLLLVSGAL